MSFKEALKVFISSEKSANDRAAAFGIILEALLGYLLEFIGIPAVDAE